MQCMTHVAQRALQSLGIHLADPLPMFILAGLATERRLLLVGLPGQAKMALVRALGEQIAPGRTRILNAALTSFDDVRGFVRPASPDAGKAEIVPGPWSPYEDELLFVDELSRAPAPQQNRWLQLIHERLVDGLPTRLRWVIAAMNPPSIDGTFPLGWAIVDRFHAVLELDDFGELEPAVRTAIAAGLVPPIGAPVDLLGHLAAIRARAESIAADPARRLVLARVTIAALDAFKRAGGPFAPQGRRAVFLTELLASLLAALEVEHGDDGPQLLGEYLDAWLTAGLTALGRAADLDEAALSNAHEAAWGAATRAWEEAFEVRGRRAVLAPSADNETGKSARLESLVRSELARPSLDVDSFSRAATELWRGHAPHGMSAADGGVRAIHFLFKGEVELEGAPIPLTEKLVQIGDRFAYLGLEGKAELDPPLEVFERFATEASARRAPDHTAWPVPFAPIAIVVPGPSLDHADADLAGSAMRLLRPAYCLPSVRATFAYEGLRGLPIITSSVVLEALARRTRAGVFHPDRPERAAGSGAKALIVFGVPHRAWHDLAALARRGL